MASRNHNRSTPPPRAVVLAIKRDEPLPNDLLMAWYMNDAPQWIRNRKIAPDLAVFIWNLPEPKAWEHIGIEFKEGWSR